MTPIPLLTLCLIAQPPSDETGTGSLESVRAEYRADAAKYAFFIDQQPKGPPTLAPKSIFFWTSLKDYSGDVLVWTKDGLPIVIGCMLSGPNGPRARNVSHEFHLVADEPIAPIDLPSRQRWEPAEGLKRLPVPNAPVPAGSAAGRLTQIRQISRSFAVQMEAVNGKWELRLLPQPLFRYGDETKDVIDGAIMAYVWTTGTDPELFLLLECRQTSEGPRWHYAPIQFTLRPLRLEHAGTEVWQVAAHKEPASPSKLLYTTGFVRTLEVTTASTSPAR